jgi:hypothetical protein
MLRDPSAPRSGEFFAPLPLVALAVLVLNDVYWKQQFHNFWTGKLSDVALCFLMPLFVSELLGLGLGLAPRVRLGCGALLCATLFSALEIWPWLSQHVVALLDRVGPHLGLGRGFQMTSDWTDLACVPLVWLAYQYGARRLSRTRRARSRSALGLA